MQYFLIFLLLLACYFGEKGLKSKIFITNIFSILIIVWNVCNNYTNEGINEAVLFTLKSNTDGAPFSDFIPYFITYISYLILSLVPLVFRKNFIFFNKKKYNILSLFVLIISISIISIKTNYIKDYIFLINNLFSNYKSAPINKVTFEKIKVDELNKINIDKNLVIIIAESLERTHRDIDGINFLPQISNLSNQFDFSNIVQTKGSGWTIAGHVNVLCGLPLVGLSNDATAMSTFLPRATCIPEVLEKKGYHSIYISGTNTQFSGTNNFLKTHGVNEVYDIKQLEKEVNKQNISKWGINDDKILDISYNIFENKSIQKENFNLIISTINTHTPNGLFLESCKHLDITKATEEIQKSIMCSDYLISEFIKKIQQSPYYKDTTIVLVSDHLMMGQHTYLKEKNRTNTFSIFSHELENKTIDDNGSLIDVLPTTLSLITSNDLDFGMGVNIISEKNKINLILNKKTESESLNIARELWAFPNINEKMIFNGKALIIGQQSIELPFSAEINKEGNITYLSNQGLVIEKHKKLILTNKYNDIIYAKKCNNSACILLGNKDVDNLLIINNVIMKKTLTKENIKDFID